MRTYSTTLLSMYAVLAAITAPAANADDDDECPHGYSAGFYCGSYPGMPSELSTDFPNVLFYCDEGYYEEEEDCGADGGSCVHADAGEEDYCSYEYEPDVDVAEEELDDPPDPAAGAGQEGGPDLPLLHSDVRLKMFWDEDYYWQESSDEAWWCVERDVDGDDCWHYNDREVECDENKVYIMECGSTSRQRWDFVDVTEPGGVTEVLIRATGEDNRCLRRDGYGDDDVELVYECNPADAMQRWAAVRGDFYGEKFELGRADDDEAEFCLSQAHHPKEGEDVRMYDCDDERDGDTSYWVIW